MSFRSPNVSSRIRRTLKQFGSKVAVSEEARRTVSRALRL